MQQKKVDADETKRIKALNLRYKKAIAKDINLEKIQEDLSDIMEACDDVRYYFEEDDDTLINALDGNEDEAFEFKMMFANLSAECESMYADLQEEYILDCPLDLKLNLPEKRQKRDCSGWENNSL